jgi:hypothetical protein
MLASPPPTTISLAVVYSMFNKFIFILCVGHFNFPASYDLFLEWCFTSYLATGWDFGEVRASLNSNCQLSYCCRWLVQLSRGWVENVSACVFLSVIDKNYFFFFFFYLELHKHDFLLKIISHF